ncbi:hypothetical protein ABW19_dt0210066 [Dactylella cylindrospora]|nr:hypothetical protein ABW19_dt0210066 [Dactylella cylindrospora]
MTCHSSGPSESSLSYAPPISPPMPPDPRELPTGWIQKFSATRSRWYYVDTNVDPPKSWWIHPMDLVYDQDVSFGEGSGDNTFDSTSLSEFSGYLPAPGAFRADGRDAHQYQFSSPPPYPASRIPSSRVNGAPSTPTLPISEPQQSQLDDTQDSELSMMDKLRKFLHLRIPTAAEREAKKELKAREKFYRSEQRSRKREQRFREELLMLDRRAEKLKELKMRENQIYNRDAFADQLGFNRNVFERLVAEGTLSNGEPVENSGNGESDAPQDVPAPAPAAPAATLDAPPSQAEGSSAPHSQQPPPTASVPQQQTLQDPTSVPEAPTGNGAPAATPDAPAPGGSSHPPPEYQLPRFPAGERDAGFYGAMGSQYAYPPPYLGTPAYYGGGGVPAGTRRGQFYPPIGFQGGMAMGFGGPEDDMFAPYGSYGSNGPISGGRDGGVARGIPMHGFGAGNRFSMPVEAPVFAETTSFTQGPGSRRVFSMSDMHSSRLREPWRGMSRRYYDDYDCFLHYGGSSDGL